MTEDDISAKVAAIVDLDIVRVTTLHALHRTVRANDPALAKIWKSPELGEWRDLRTHPQYGPVAEWMWDVEGRSCELKYELVAEFGDNWDELNDVLCAEVLRRRMT
ncbi:hypothetical protein PWG15_20240 [Ensifer adhaerens]|uniref:hypothetical protein n=1 Tax=Ensifer adhaerens TaxID=106592 RepID=UPI0023A92962|nr:hypothetical protein [Ensifer adhaerens]WDZ76882.1 hypothetical protein PWG15_20240 [Ensifer adhaerens]